MKMNEESYHTFNSALEEYIETQTTETIAEAVLVVSRSLGIDIDKIPAILSSHYKELIRQEMNIPDVDESESSMFELI